jgi:hypothetical protein
MAIKDLHDKEPYVYALEEPVSESPFPQRWEIHDTCLPKSISLPS